MTPKDVLKLCQQKRVQLVDLRFMDLPGAPRQARIRTAFLRSVGNSQLQRRRRVSLDGGGRLPPERESFSHAFE